MFTPLNLPQANLKLSRKEGKIYVWCIIRKKNLLLTPEEWVRQHAIHFLIHTRNYPIGLIASELGIQVNKLVRRCDIVVYNRSKKPILLVECKSTDVILTEQVIHQIAQYNRNLNVPHLWITNGISHRVFEIDAVQNSLIQLEDIPFYSEK